MICPERRFTPPAPRIYTCPRCCREIFERVYIDRTGVVQGCDRCLQEKAAEEVLPGRCV